MLLKEGPIHRRRLLRRLLPGEPARPRPPALPQLLLTRHVVRELLQRGHVGRRVAPLHDDDRVAAHFLEPSRSRGDDGSPDANASSTCTPKPSYSDGYSSTSAAR